MPSIDLVKDSFRLHLKTMKIMGLYPYESWPQIYIPYSLFFYLTFTITPPMLATIYLIVVKETDVYVIAQNGFMILQLLIRILKLLRFKTHPEDIKRTIQALNKPIFNRQLPEQDYILSDIVMVCKYLVKIISPVSSSCVVAWGARPLMYEKKTYPFDIWLPFDPFNNAAVYWSVYLYLIISKTFISNICNYILFGVLLMTQLHHQRFVLLMEVLACVAKPVGACAFEDAILDTFMSGLIYQAAGQLRILKDTLMYLNERVERQVSEENKEMSLEDKEKIKAKIVYRKISECVDHYDAIFEYVNDLESCYSFTIFIQFVGSIMVLCICILRLTAVEPFGISFFVTATFSVAFLMQIFLFCYFGTTLYDESDTVINAIYMSEWYMYDQKSKKALLTLMERAKRPMKITVGKLVDLSLETFTTILRRSYSLLAVLQNY